MMSNFVQAETVSHMGTSTMHTATSGVGLVHVGPGSAQAAEGAWPKEWLVGKDAETHFCKYQFYHGIGAILCNQHVWNVF